MTTTILVIDDSEDDQRLYRRALKDVDCRLVMASSAQEGFISMADLRPGVILLDYNLPDFDGLSFVKVLAGCSGPSAPVIMLTGEGSEAVAVEVLKNGADDYLVKDTAGQYLRLLPGVIARVVASHAQREQNQRLQQATARLLRRNQMLMQNTADGIHVMDSQGNLVEANDAFCRMLGYTQEEAAGLNVADWDARWTADELRARFRNFIGKSGVFETMHRRKDGTLISVEVSVSSAEIEGQQLFFALSRDITERKKAEKALNASESRWRSITQNSPDHIIMVDPEGIILFINHTVPDMTPGQVIGTSIFGYIPDKFRSMAHATFQRVLNSGMPDRYETEYCDAEGNISYFDSNIGPILDHGQIVALIVSARDITARRKTEEALLKNEANLRAILDNSPYLTWLKDAKGRYITVNKVFADYLRLESVNQVAGMTDLDLQPPELAEKYRADDVEVMASLKQKHVEEPAFDGKAVHWVETYKTPIIDAYGNVLGTVGFAHDITERKRVEQALREADQRKDEFLAMLAHELRNPLAPIRNAAHVLGRLELTEPRVRWAQQIIEEQVTHLSRMVDDLMDVSRIARNKITLKKETIELANLVEQVIESARPLAAHKGQQLALRLPGQAVQLEGDPVRLSQVLFNLIDNAIKYTPDNGQIELAARMDGEEIEIVVRDNGMGITAELLPHVFDLFQQDERALDRAQGGLGIGLTLVQRLVGMHGGRVEAYSAGPGLGSTFTVRLPARVTPAQSAATEAKDPDSTTKGMRVLVVDDDYHVANSTAVVLEMDGYEVRVVTAGQAALEMAPEFRPQVVLLDIGLKGMDGFETAQRLRELPEGRGLCLVAVTGYGDEKTRARAMASGYDHFLVKPVTYKTLSALLARIAGKVSGAE